MDALEFARELKRMCCNSRGCPKCPAAGCGCNICNLEALLPIVEKWSKEHPKTTNLDHYADCLEKLGYEVDKEELRRTCPTHKSKHFTKEVCKGVASDCSSCLAWWDEEFKETDKS